MVELYIKKQKVDVPENFSILWSYKSKDLSAPTAVKNGFSKQIEVKGTPNNNRIFNSLYRIDSSYTNFNPNIRNEFILKNNGSVIESGYVQLNKISKTNSEISYSLTLFGGLGDFFYNLSTNEDGEKKTLYNLQWYWLKNKDLNPSSKAGTVANYDSPINTTYHPPLTIDQEKDETIMDISPFNIALGWRDLLLADNEKYLMVNNKKYTNVRDDIVFMPFDTGKPNIDNFDCTSLLQREITNYNSQYWNTRQQFYFPTKAEDDTSYYSKDVYYGDTFLGSYVKTKSQRDLSQLEVGSLINTQMVPGIKISKLLDVICDEDNNGGYAVNIDAVKDDPVIKDGYTLLDRIKLEDINSVITLAKDIDTTIKLDTNGSSEFSPRTEINLLSGTFNKNLFTTEEISSINMFSRYEVKSSFKTVLGGYIQNHQPLWNELYIAGGEHYYNPDGYAWNYLEVSQIDFPLFNIYNFGDVEYLKHTMSALLTKTLPSFNFSGTYIGEGTATNVAMGWYPSWDSFVSKLNFEGRKSTKAIKNLDRKKLLAPVSWYTKFDPNTSTKVQNKASVYFDVVYIENEAQTQRIYYVYPYVYYNDINYPLDSDDTTQYNDLGIPTDIYNWVTSSEFNTTINNYISNTNNIIDHSKTIIGTHIENVSFRKATVSDININITDAKTGVQPMWNHSTVMPGTGIDVFRIEETDLMYWITPVETTQTYAFSTKLDIDEEEINQITGTNVTFHNLRTYAIAFIDFSGYPMTSIETPSSNKPNNYLWQPSSYKYLLYKNNINTNGDFTPLSNYVNKFPTYLRNESGFIYVNEGYPSSQTWINKYAYGTSYNTWAGDRDIFTVNPPSVYNNINTGIITKFNGDDHSLGEQYITKKSIFNNTNSPYEYLISLAKLLNWKFDYNYIEKKITIMHNEDYYTTATPPALTIDYSKKYEITPYILNKQWIDLKLSPINSYSNYLYEKNYDDAFNKITYNNNYSFSNDTEDLLKGIIFKSGSEFVPNTPLFDQASPFIPTPNLGSTMVHRWANKTDSNYESHEICPKIGINAQNNNIQYDYPMLCCYDASYNYLSPKNIIVMFNGFLSNEKLLTYVTEQQYRKTNYFGISKHIPSVYDKLNGGDPCYVNSIFLKTNGEITGRWIWQNADEMVWTPYIPFFSLYKFLDKNNKNIDDISTSLLDIQQSYYPINKNYDLKIRIKSLDNTDIGSSTFEIGRWGSYTGTQTKINDEQTHIFDAGYYTNSLLDGIASTGNTLNFYQNIISNITDNDARQIKVKARLNTTPNVALKSIYTLSGGKYIITSIDNYDITQTNPFCDVTLQKINNI